MIHTAYVNLRTGRVVNTMGGFAPFGGVEPSPGCPPADVLVLQRGDTPTLRLRFFDPWNDDDADLLADGTALRAVLKKWDDHNGDPLAAVEDDDWDKPASLSDNAATDLTDDPGGFYLGTLDLSGDDLDDLLPAGTGSYYCHLQIETSLSGVVQSSQWIPVLVQSDVARGTDGAVISTTQPVPSAPLYYKAITALTGGGATALDGIPTVGKSLILVVLYVADELQWWRLFAGTTAEDSANGIVRPDDYNATTNAQIWKRVA
ncbi:MAG: hypothetical protein KCHDKBKB_03043 [Elusimicrobia bacterium]|nr:hypothetical protein [Elusimicrobiota bacterium]